MRFVTGLAAVLFLAACGAPVPPVSPAASPSVPATAAGNQLTNADAGRTVTMKVGDSVEVALRQEPGFTGWQGVQSSDTMVLQPAVDPRAAAVVGMSLHNFRAVGPGQAQIFASATVLCSPGAACPALARDWRVTVIVT
jgi:hypothetical protein